MKVFKKKVARPRKRVIAILLSLLMVLSIVIPSGGSSVRYNAYAEGEESALGEGVDVTTEEEITEEATEEDISATSEEASSTTEDITDSATEETVTETTEETTEGMTSEVETTEEDVLTSQDTEDDEDDEIIDDQNLLRAEQSTELINYVTNADAQTGVTYDSNTNTWSGINLNNEYEFTIYFTESQIRQFIDTDTTMTYNIPAGIVANNISSTYIDLVYNLGGSGDTIKVSNNPFRIENNVIYFNFNTGDGNFGTLKSSDDAQFHLTFKGKFDGSRDLIQFSDNVTRNIETNTAKDVTVEKSSNGTISADSDTINYTVKVKSSGYNEGITFDDALDDNSKDYFEIVDVTPVVKDSYGNIVTTGISVTETSSSASDVSYSIDKLYNGYYVEFNYKVRAKNNNKSNIVTADSNNDGRVTIGNTASVTTSSTESDTSNNSVSTTKDITYTSISSKSAAVTDEENGIVTWTIKLNPERIVSLSGKNLSDVLTDDSNTINDNQKFYSDITIKGYTNSEGSGDPAFTDSLTKPADSSFTYSFTDDRALYYEITYQTQAQDMNKQIADMKLTNTATYPYGSKSAEATISIDPDKKVILEKEATAVTGSYIDWRVTLEVPASGLDSLVLEDIAPRRGDQGYYDEVDMDSINVSGLNAGESATATSHNVTRINGTQIVGSFDLTFKKSNGQDGLDSGLDKRTIVITYRSNVDESWLAAATSPSGGWLKTHTNTVNVNANGITLSKTADATPVAPEILKKKGDNFPKTVEIDGTKFPCYEFQIRVAPISDDTINIYDVLPEGFVLYGTPASYGTDEQYWPNPESNQAVSVTSPDANNKVTFTITTQKKNAEDYYRYTWLVYSIIPKDKTTLLDLDQRAINSGNGSVALVNSAEYLGEETDFDFDYTPNKSDNYTLTKEVVSQDNDKVNYKIDVNPERLRLNNGENITLTDTFTNLSIDYSTIKVTAVNPANAEVVSCDVRNNVMTVVLNDEAHYTIEYESTILSTGEYKNVAEVSGFTATKSDSYSSSGGGNYGNQLSINIFKQEYGNALNKLEGVEFQLFVDDNGTKVPVKDADGNIVTATTDENGKATFQGSNTAGWKIVKDQKYYIKELNPPEGYLGIDEMYTFTVSDVSDWTNYVYKTGETMRVDNDKIDLKVTKTLDNAPDDLDLNSIIFTVVVSEGEGDNATTKTYTKTLAEIKADANKKWCDYDLNTNTYTWYFANLTTGSNATVTETINASTADQNPSSISYSILNDGTATVADHNYTSGTGITVTGLANDSIRTVAFTNSYAGSVDVTPVVYKKLDGKTSGTGSALTFPLDGLLFDFSLYEISDSLYPADHGAIADLSDKWNTTASYTAAASDSTGGKAEFPKITKVLGGTATYPIYYYYKIVENPSGFSKITDDSDYVVMTVVINKDSTTQAITKSISYTKYNSDGTVDVPATTDPKAVVFNNTTDNTTLTINAKKILIENGESVTPDNVFTFKLEPVALDGVTDDQTNASQDSVSNNAGTVTFAELTYDGSDINSDSSKPTVYRYKISENDVPEGYSKDTNYYYVDVTVTRDTTTGGVKTAMNVTKYNSAGTKIEDNVALSRISFTNERSARTGSVTLSSRKTIDNETTDVNGTNYSGLRFYCVYLGIEKATLQADNIPRDVSYAGTPVEAVMNSGTNIISFPSITYSSANGINTELGIGKHIYKIYEGTSGYSGIRNSSDYYIVVVNVEDPLTGTTLNTNIDKVYKYAYDSTTDSYTATIVPGSGTDNVIFDNTTNKVKLSLKATKFISDGTNILDNYDLEGFEFKITAIDTTSSGGKYYNAASGGYEKTVTSDSTGNATFPDLIFDVNDVGVYTFEITENEGSDTSLDYDKSIYTVTVNVSVDSVSKALKAEVTEVSKKANATATPTNVSTKRVEFTNKLKTGAGSISLSAKKTLKKAGETAATSTITDDEGNLKTFSFKLEQVNNLGDTASYTYSQTKQNNINGTISFDAINYDINTDPDVLTNQPYYYKISEVPATEFDGYTYSTDVYYVKVELDEDAANNRIVTRPTYYKNSIGGTVVTADDVIFENSQNEAVLSLEATKELVGANLSDYNGQTDGFEFTATRGDKVYRGYNAADGSVEIVINEVFSIVDVAKTSTGINAAPYEYVIKETSKTGFDCDTVEYIAKVTFSLDATDGSVKPNITYYKSTDTSTPITHSEVKFKNTKTDTQEIEITAKKTFQNAEPNEKVFSFGLYEGDDSTPIQIKQNDSEGNIEFDKITYNQDDLGALNTKTYTYKVKEIQPSPRPLPGYDYDERVYTITVTLTRNSDTGKIDVTHIIDKSGSDGTGSVGTQGGTNTIGKNTSGNEFIIFDNDYDGTVRSWPLSVRKILSSNEDVQMPFTFALYQCTDDTFDIAGLTPLATVTTDNTGVAVFPTEINHVAILDSTPGDRYFLVKEVPGDNPDPLVSYTNRVYKLRVNVDSNAVITVFDYDDSTKIYESGQITFTNSIQVNVKKTDINGTDLEGATLQVTSNGAVINTSGNSATTNGISDNTYTGITVGQEYTLSEVTAPIGYSKAEDIKFKVVYNSTDKKYELKIDYGDGNGYVDASTTEPITVTMKDEAKSIVINKKVSGTDAFLGGATLQIKDPSGTVVESAWTTDTLGGTLQNHSFSLGGLNEGVWYTLEETAAPYGYKIAESVQFMIDSDNKVWSKKSSDPDSAKIELTAVNGKYTLVMYDEPLKFTITKYKKDSTDKLTGAVFQIYKQSDNGLVQSGIAVNSNGSVELDALALGIEADTDYILEETSAPNGYELAAPITFKITSDNKLVVDGVTQTGTEIKVYDKPEGTIYISKVDPSNPGTELTGAWLVINQNGVEKFRIHTASSAKDISTRHLVKNEIYILKEIEAPKDANGVPTHYIASEIKFYIDNNSDLFVQRAGEADYSPQPDGKIVMEDRARNVVKISKIDLVTSDELPNAKLKITEVNGNPVYEKTIDRDGNLITTNNKLEHTTTGTKWEIDYATFDLDKEYVLTEVTAPDGYEVAESITFKLVEEGGSTVVKIKQNDGTWVTNSNLTVVMQDAPLNNVSFIKLDKSSGQTLAGAGLTIYDSYGQVAYSFTTTAQATVFRTDDFNVNEEYTLRETGVPNGFYQAADVTFRVSFVNGDNGRIRKLFVLDNSDGTFKVVETGQIVIEDERIYKVKVSKVDITTEEEVPGAHIQILDERGSVVAEWDSTDTPKEIEGLRPGVTYTLKETVAPLGYKITTDTTFALKADATIDYSKTTTSISSDGVLLVKDDITSLNFTKYGLINESCAPDPAAFAPIAGVEFTAYAVDDAGNISDTPAATATSSENGIVIFTRLPKGKYAVRETKSVGGYKLCEDTFYATVDDNDFAGLTDKDGNKIEANRVVDDQYRTDIMFTKVSERNQAKKLADSKYGLYRKNSLKEESLIATAISDKDGLVTFKGVLTNTNYVIRELESPEGYYVSEHPIEISFKLSDEEVVLSSFDDGNGTAVVGANGEITWLEPSVIVNFLKVDENGNPLPGATLAILDKDGATVKDADGKELKWVSGTELYTVSDVFEDGETYKLVELAAPEGYALAEPVEFEIPSDKVETGENKIISVVMKDVPITTVTPPEKTTPPSVKTGDTTPIKPVTSMMFISLAGIIYLLILRRKHKDIL